MPALLPQQQHFHILALVDSIEEIVSEIVSGCEKGGEKSIIEERARDEGSQCTPDFRARLTQESHRFEMSDLQQQNSKEASKSLELTIEESEAAASTQAHASRGDMEIDRDGATSTAKTPLSSTSDDGNVNVNTNGVARLSKWAARLFDPDRPRGLVQAPQTIPLNDEFLQAFGRREKDTVRGKALELDIQHTIVDNDDNDESSTKVSGDTETPEMDEAATATTITITGSRTDRKKRKIKITNLKYSTTAATLQEACESFGPVELTNLIMQTESGGHLNAGLAYVTFQHATSAQACVEGLKLVDHRTPNVTLAAGGGKAGASSGPSAATASRYFVPAAAVLAESLSIKCFRCGAPGHMAASCPNEAVRKPCPLCASLDHEMRFCPVRTVCFNCGIPGHISRECPRSRGTLPQRRLCTVCYQTFSHSKADCRPTSSAVVPPDAALAICAVCGRTGHYLCRPLQWFFGLQGVSCSKWYVRAVVDCCLTFSVARLLTTSSHCICLLDFGSSGRPGHIGAHCVRPDLEVCARNEEIVCHEIEMASTVSSVEEFIAQANRSRHGKNGNHSNNNNNSSNSSGQRRQNGNTYNRHNDTEDPAKERGRAEQRPRHIERTQFRPYKSVPPPPRDRQRDYGSQHPDARNSSNSYHNNKRKHGS